MLILLQANVAAAAALARPLEERLADVARLVERYEVDLVAVQGGTNGSDGTPLDRLAALLPAHSHVARHAGMAVFSRVPLALAEVVALTGLDLAEDPSRRHLLVVRLPDHALTLAVGHFSWVDAQARRNVSDATTALAGHGDVLLVGDFNQRPDSGALAALQDADFADPWPRLQPGDDGFTYEIGKRWGRIDYVLERGKRPLVTAIDLLATEPSEAVSDHALLLAMVDR